MGIADDTPRPRLCHLRKLPNFPGYGFNLHAEKGKSGQFIGKIDPGSPADQAGLKEGDRIVEVNGTNVANENHQQVVERIKAVPDETKFLVVDPEADAYYLERKIVVSGDIENILMIETPLPGSAGPGDAHKPRLCHMQIWPDFAGYGFNLHAEKGRSAQFIGKVDPDSPAEAAGLKEGDRIIEVNGTCVLTETHQEVVKKIKSDPNRVTMLLLDPEAEEYFKEKGITVTSTHPSVEIIYCPETNPHTAVIVSVSTTAKMPTSAPAAAAFSSVEPVHQLRLCHIHTAPDGSGFGFNMQSDKSRPGQFIGAVDANSPAQKAGLKKGDRIIEVNGENTETCSHKEVVEKIKGVPGETKLLVVDAEADEYFKTQGITALNSSSPFVARSGNVVENGTAESEEDLVVGPPDYDLAASDVQERAVSAEINTDLYENSESEVLKVETLDENANMQLADCDGITEEQNKGFVVEQLPVAVDESVTDYSTDVAEYSEVKRDRSSDLSKDIEKADVDYETVADEIAAVVKTEEKKAEATKPVLTLKVDAPVPATSKPVEQPKTVESPKSPVVINGIEFAASAEEARKKMSKKKSVKETSMSMKDKYALFEKM